MKNTNFIFKHVSVSIILIPGVISAFVIHYFAPPLINLFAYGGIDVFFYNTCILIFIPYSAIFLVALGKLYLSRLPKQDQLRLNRLDRILFSFFAGCGVLTILGFVLGLINLLYFWICFPIFLIVLYIYFFHSNPKQVIVDFWEWVTTKRVVANIKFVLIVERLLLFTIIIAIILSKGILLEMFKDGGLHQYFGYFAETSLLHSTWMEPSHPILFDYLAGRGQGVLLFFTSFTNQFTIQIIGTIYLISIALVSRQVIVLILFNFGETNKKNLFYMFLPDLVLILALTSLMLDMETARFHLQTGAFFMFLAWASCMFHIVDAKKSQWLFLVLIPIVVAFPITGGIYFAFVGWILGITLLTLIFSKHSSILKYPFLLFLYGAFSAIVSFGLNWLYVGIPEIQPARLFVPFIWMDRFQFWSSEALITYMYLTFSQTVSAANISIEKIALDSLSLFFYPIGLLAKQINYPKFLLGLYPIFTITILVWIINRNVRNRDSVERGGFHDNRFFLYWLTFVSLYILKLLLTSVIQQGSLKRMLLFMEVFPIIVFFSLVVFLIYEFKGMENRIDLLWKFQYSIQKNKNIAFVVISLVLGCGLTLALINLYTYFWRLSLTVKVIWLIISVVVGGASMSYIWLRWMIRYFGNFRRNNGLSQMASVIVISFLFLAILFPFTPLSLQFPISHQLRITALDNKNMLSQSSIVKLAEVKVDGKNIRFNLLDQSGKWSDGQGVIQSEGIGTLTYTFTTDWHASIEILFKSGPTSGKVQIEYDEQEPVIKDLYSDNQGDTRVFSQSSINSNKTSLLFMGLLLIAEFLIIFWLVSLVFSRVPLQTTYVNAFLLFGMTLTFFQFENNLGFGKVIGGWKYFSGQQGAIQAYDPLNLFGARSDIFHCLEILEVVPGSAQILNLNGLGAVEPCLFSPLLPRDKIIQYYESVPITEPYYETLMFGEPEVAYAIYRDLGIDYFYLRKEDTLFVNLGYSEALKPENLEKYFDIYVETDDFYILTWRGQGMYPISQQLAQDIFLWYQRSKNNLITPWWLGRESLKEWIQSQE